MSATTSLAVLTWGAFAGKLPIPILVLYLVASVATFVAYARDKLAAREGRWRTQESTLHLLGLIGGWPGALAAQHLHRHRSKKLSFQVVFWLTVALNCGALGWLLSPAGESALKTIFNLA